MALTVNLPEPEEDALRAICFRRNMTQVAVLREAFALYRLIDARISAGETMYFSGDKEREVLFGCLGIGGGK